MKRYKILSAAALLFFVSVGADTENDYGDLVEKTADLVEKSATNGVEEKPVLAIFPVVGDGSVLPDAAEVITGRLRQGLLDAGQFTVLDSEHIDLLPVIERGDDQGVTIDSLDMKLIRKKNLASFVISGTVSGSEKSLKVQISIIHVSEGTVKTFDREYAKNPYYNSPYFGKWDVEVTAPYLLSNRFRCKTLVLGSDGHYKLSMENSAGKEVVQQGRYQIEGNQIDFFLEELYFNGVKQYSQGYTLKGSIFLVDEKLYFSPGSRSDRFDAMKTHYRNVGFRASEN